MNLVNHPWYQICLWLVTHGSWLMLPFVSRLQIRLPMNWYSDRRTSRYERCLDFGREKKNQRKKENQKVNRGLEMVLLENKRKKDKDCWQRLPSRRFVSKQSRCLSL